MFIASRRKCIKERDEPYDTMMTIFLWLPYKHQIKNIKKNSGWK